MSQLLTIDQFHENIGTNVASRTVKNAGITGHLQRGTIAYRIDFEDGATLDVKPIVGLDGQPALSVVVSKVESSTSGSEHGPESLHLQVDWHPSGRYTLKEGTPGRWSDCRDPSALFANDDKGEFYRAVAKRLAQLASKGVPFVFNDVTYDHD